MKLMIISASMRPDSVSARCARYLANTAEKIGFEAPTVVDLGTNPLPLWDIDLGEGAPHWANWRNLKNTLQGVDAVILISPEWHGMATPAMKNFLLLCSQEELGHKPGLPVGVSASVNGVYPISEMRITGTKNNHLCLIPEQLIFRKAGDLVTEAAECTDSQFAERCEFALSLLLKYAEALQHVREDDRFPSDTFRNGM